MKILHLLSQRPEGTGSGIYTQAMMREAAKRGHVNFLLAGVPLGEESKLEVLEEGGSEFVRFHGGDLPFAVVGMSDVMPYPSKRFRDLTAEEMEAYTQCFTKKLKSLVQQIRPEIIHSNHLWILTALARRLFPNLPLIATCHGSDLRQFHFCPHLRDRVAPECRKLARILALSQAQKEDIVRLYEVPPEMVAVVGAGYNQALFFPEIKPRPDPVEIVYAGKLSRAKGVPWLLRALGQLLHLPWRLNLVGGGSGEEKEEVLGLASQLEARVRIPGPLSQVELARRMRQAHLVVLPSFFEGLPLVILEALACGCRVVTTALPGIGEMMGEQKTAALALVPRPRLRGQDIPYEEDEEVFVRDLAVALETQILGARMMPDLNLGDLRGLLEHYSWPRVFSRVEQIYLTLCP